MLGSEYTGFIDRTYKISKEYLDDYSSFTYTFYRSKKDFLVSAPFVITPVPENEKTLYRVANIFKTTQQECHSLLKPEMMVAQIEIPGYSGYTFVDADKFIEQIRDGGLILFKVNEKEEEDHEGQIYNPIDGKYRFL